MEHFMIEYARYINEMLHRVEPSWHYQHEIYEVPDIVTALLVTHDDQHEDEFQIESETRLEDFVSRIGQVLPYVTDSEALQNLFRQSERGLMGWTRRTIWFVKEGKSIRLDYREGSRGDTRVAA